MSRLTDIQKRLDTKEVRIIESFDKLKSEHKIEFPDLWEDCEYLLKLVSIYREALEKISKGPFKVQVGGIGTLLDPPNARTLELNNPIEVARAALKAGEEL